VRRSGTVFGRRQKALQTELGMLQEFPAEWKESPPSEFKFVNLRMEGEDSTSHPMIVGYEDWLTISGNDFADAVEDAITEDNLLGLQFVTFAPGMPPDMLNMGVIVKVLEQKKESKDTVSLKVRTIGRIGILDYQQTFPTVVATQLELVDDKPGLKDEMAAKQMLEELIKIYDENRELEADVYKQYGKTFTAVTIRMRKSLRDILEERAATFNVDPVTDLQGYCQLAAFLAMDHYIINADRYDACMLEYTEDRMRYVRDKLRLVLNKNRKYLKDPKLGMLEADETIKMLREQAKEQGVSEEEFDKNLEQILSTLGPQLQAQAQQGGADASSPSNATEQAATS